MVPKVTIAWLLQFFVSFCFCFHTANEYSEEHPLVGRSLHAWLFFLRCNKDSNALNFGKMHAGCVSKALNHLEHQHPCFDVYAGVNRLGSVWIDVILLSLLGWHQLTSKSPNKVDCGKVFFAWVGKQIHYLSLASCLTHWTASPCNCSYVDGFLLK